MELSFQTDPDDVSIIELLDRILDKGIVLEPWDRITLAMRKFSNADDRIVVAPDRRRKPFIVPINRRS